MKKKYILWSAFGVGVITITLSLLLKKSLQSPMVEALMVSITTSSMTLIIGRLLRTLPTIANWSLSMPNSYTMP